VIKSSTNEEVIHNAVFSNPYSSTSLLPNILLNTLLSNSLNVCSSFRVKDHLTDPYRLKVDIQWNFYKSNFKGNKKIFEL
jgi:hypothetical protein